MKTKITRQNYGILLIQLFTDDDEELDEVKAVTNGELLKLMQFVKNEIGGDWPDVIEYLTDRSETL